MWKGYPTGKLIKRGVEPGVLEINEETLLDIEGYDLSLKIRRGGEFTYKGFLLPNNLVLRLGSGTVNRWETIIDDEGELVLIPRKIPQKG